MVGLFVDVEGRVVGFAVDFNSGKFCSYCKLNGLPLYIYT